MFRLMSRSFVAVIPLMSMGLMTSCSTTTKFKVKSDPLQSDVFVLNPKTGDRKNIGKTPLEIPAGDLKTSVGDIASGEFFTLTVEHEGYKPESFSIPASRFGTMVTEVNAKLKTSNVIEESRLAKTVLDQLFLAQKFALTNQFERAQIEIDKILGNFPGFPRALTMRASIYFAQRNYPESLRWYEEAIKHDPQLEDAVKMAAKLRGLMAGNRLPSSALPARGAK